jgi:hypothetical protein
MNTEKHNLLSRLLFSAIVLTVCILTPFRLVAQLSFNAENMALGGGGTAYITGSDALFINPANLLIQEKTRKVSLTFMQGSSYWYGLNETDNIQDRFEEYRVVLKPFDPSTGLQNRSITQDEREKIINRNFYNGQTNRTFTAQSELNWFGIKWFGNDKAYAVSLRTRIGNRYTLGQGLFNDEGIQHNDDLIIDRSFQHIYQIQHELSFGYSESFTFLNGIHPRSSEFIIGFAPKLILPGSGLNVNSTDLFRYQPETTNWERETEYLQTTSGALTEQIVESYRNFNDQAGQTLLHHDISFNDLMKPTGVGLGLDIGLTYLITFGSDLSLLIADNKVTNRSIRFSISMTDIGATLFKNEPSEISVDNQTIESNETGTLAEITYRGSPNEHYFFLNQLGIQIPDQSGGSDESQFLMMLPASIQTGALFQYNWFKLMGDASYSMVESALKPSGFVSYLGAEIRPFHFLPLRAGTRFGRNLPHLFSFGTGFETDGFDLNAAFMIQTGDLSDPLFSGEIVGASLLGVRIHL